MKGILLPGDGQVVVKEFEKPVPGYGQVVIKMKTAAICGSDLHHLKHKHIEGESPFIVGHEPCGVVDTVGEGVSNVKVGQRVALYHYQGCGVCEWCARGQYRHCKKLSHFASPGCHGSDAEYLLCNATQCCYPLPDNLTFIDGSLIACNAGTAYSALKKLRIGNQKVLCIYGLGPVGLSAAILAKQMGVKRIYGVDPNPSRREMAIKTGVEEVFGTTNDDMTTIIGHSKGGVNCTLETSGSSAAQRMCIQTAAKRGKIVVVGMSGVYDTDGGVNLSTLINREITVIGSWVMDRDEFIELIEFAAEKDIHFDKMVSHTFTIDQAEEAFRLYASGKTGKVIFQF